MTDEHIRDVWFGGNAHALEMYRLICSMSHVWDDLIDKDKAVSDAAINGAFMTALVYLQSNPFYRSIQDAVLPIWLSVCSSYEVANHFEQTGDPHGLELAHGLRYAGGQVIAYAVITCLGYHAAVKVLPEVWKQMVPERIHDYLQEHLHD